MPDEPVLAYRSPSGWTHASPSTPAKCWSNERRSAPDSIACAAIQMSFVGSGRPFASLPRKSAAYAFVSSCFSAALSRPPRTRCR